MSCATTAAGAATPVINTRRPLAQSSCVHPPLECVNRHCCAGGGLLATGLIAAGGWRLPAGGGGGRQSTPGGRMNDGVAVGRHPSGCERLTCPGRQRGDMMGVWMRTLAGLRSSSPRRKPIAPSTSSSSAPARPADGPPSASPRPACAWPCSRPGARSPTPTTRSTSPHQLKYRGRTKTPLERTQPVQSQSYAVREWNADWYVNDIEEPYLDDSDPRFLWVRPRVVGGRMNIWGRGCLRMSDIDFKAASHDGVGVDWPITYADIKPYYDLVEEYVGVSGHEGRTRAVSRRSLPAADGPHLQRDGAPLARQEGVRATRSRRAAPPTSRRPINGRQACHYCGPCEHGCMTHSYFNSAFTTMKDAMATGRCTLVTGAMAYKVLDGSRDAPGPGVLYIDRDHAAAAARSSGARWRCARRRSSPCACSSTRRRARTRTASRTRAASWAST